MGWGYKRAFFHLQIHKVDIPVHLCMIKGEMYLNMSESYCSHVQLTMYFHLFLFSIMEIVSVFNK